MEQKPSQKSSGVIMAALGAVLLVAGLLICAFIYGVVLKNDHSEFGGMGEGFMIMCGGVPIALTGLVLLVVGLITSSIEKKK